MNEIEIKFRVTAEDHKRITEILSASSQRESIETDTYFTSKHRDFIASEECLRIRESRDHLELTWKPPTSIEMKASGHFWKEELNVTIVSDPQVLQRLLLSVDFIVYSVVRKMRRSFRIDDDTTVVLDHVETAGFFVEIETLGDSIEEAIAKNMDIVNRLSLQSHEVIKTPYRDLVAKGTAP